MRVNTCKNRFLSTKLIPRHQDNIPFNSTAFLPTQEQIEKLYQYEYLHVILFLCLDQSKYGIWLDVHQRITSSWSFDISSLPLLHQGLILSNLWHPMVSIGSSVFAKHLLLHHYVGSFGAKPPLALLPCMVHRVAKSCQPFTASYHLPSLVALDHGETLLCYIFFFIIFIGSWSD